MLEPFGEKRHRELARKVRAFGDTHLRARVRDEADPEGGLRELAGMLAAEQLLEPAILPPYGTMDLRSVAVVREGLAYFSSLADAAFAAQGLGSYPVSLAGTDSQKDRWLPAAVRGEVLCCLALTEPEAGSDLGAIRALAEPDGALWRLSGVKTLISNAVSAGMYTVLARSSSARGTTGLSMFLVDADAPGTGVKALETTASLPMGEIRLDATPAVLLGGQGKGYGLAMATLDTFRPSLGAAACGLAARALDEAVSWSLSRRQFGQRIADFQATRLAIAEMHADLAGARLLVGQAAWTKDSGAARITREGAVAKLAASEMAQRVVDRAVQLHGGQGLMRGATVERLYRDVRSLRVRQGTSEILKLVIAGQILKERR